MLRSSAGSDVYRGQGLLCGRAPPWGHGTPIANGVDVLLLGLLGVVALGAIVCVNRSLAYAPASVVVPYQYTMIVWAIVAVAAAPLAITLNGALSGAGWEAQGSTSQVVRDELRNDFASLGAEAAFVVFQQKAPLADDPTQLDALVAALADAPGAEQVVDPRSMPAESGLLAQDGRTALVPVAPLAEEDAALPESGGRAGGPVRPRRVPRGGPRCRAGGARGLLAPGLKLSQIPSAPLESGVLANRAVLDDLARLRDAGLAVGLTLSGPRQGEAGVYCADRLVIWGGGRHIGIYLGKRKAISAINDGVTIHKVNALTDPFTTYLHVKWKVPAAESGFRR